MTTPDEAPASAAPTDTQHEPLRLLYVEDDRLNAILFEEALRLESGLELRLAVDAQDALEQVKSWCPDLLVIDAQLPDMDGYELLMALRKQPALQCVPAIMCSADTLPEDVQRAYDAGFDGFWPKPIDVTGILADLQGRVAAR